MMNIKNKIFFKICCCILSMTLVAPYAYAGQVGIISHAEGRVDVQRPNAQLVIPVRKDEPIFEGDIIRTKSNSKAEVTFKDNSILRLAPGSRVEISEYRLSEDNRRNSAQVNVLRGKVRTIIEKMPDASPFKIVTPNAEGTVKGSDIFAFFQAGNSGMMVAEGNLSVINPVLPAPPVLVPSGSSILVPEVGAPKGPRAYLELEKKFNEQETDPSVGEIPQQKLDEISGMVTKVSGVAKITPKDSSEAHDARVNDVVEVGFSIETGENGMLEIKFDNGNAMNFKNNTKLVISKMSVDPQTREYECLFEMSTGKVRARVENLKGASSFKIKTPTAITGVRGTIMYVEIAKTMTTKENPNCTDKSKAVDDQGNPCVVSEPVVATKVLFEGGNGFITSLLSGDTKDVGIGQTALSDDQGAVSQPVVLPGEERSDFVDGWDPGSGIEGYSSPEGSTGLYLYESATDTNVPPAEGGAAGEGTPAGDTATNPTGTTGDQYQDSPPVTETVIPPAEQEIQPPPPPPEPQPEPQPEPTPFDFTGHFGYFDGDGQTYLDYGLITGSLETSAAPWAGPVDMTISGTYEPPVAPYEDRNKLWGTDYFRMTGSDDSAALSVLGGTNVNGELDGMLYGLYVRPDGSTGYLESGLLTGNFNPDDQTFFADGTLSAYQMGTTLATPEQLEVGSDQLDFDTMTQARIAGDILGFTADDGDVGGLIDQNWQIWKMGLGGTFNGTPSSDWKAVFGSIDHYSDSNEYMIGSLDGASWQDGKLSGEVHARRLTEQELGEMNGRLLGDYADGTWEALSAGIGVESLLQFGGDFNVSFDDTVFLGLFGGTESLWSGTPQVTLQGEVNNFGNYVYSGHLNGQTVDGASLLGLLGGIKAGDISQKMLYALYLRPEDTGYRAGYVKSTDMTGSFYPGLGMFEDEGTMQSFAKQLTTYTPGSFYEGGAAIEYGNETATLNSENFSGTFASHTEKIKDQNWGLQWMNGGGDYEGLPSDGWTAFLKQSSQDVNNNITVGYVLGQVTGSAWENNAFSGTGSGRSISYNPYRPLSEFNQNALGTFETDMLGVYTDAGTWQGLGMGTYEETPLQFGGSFDQTFGVDPNLITMTGIFGGTESFWSGPAEFIMLGEYNDPGDYDFWTFVDDAVTGRTSDGSAFYGMLDGIKAFNNLQGLFYAFYAKPDGHIGYIKSTHMDGTVYPGINMFEQAGTMTSYLDIQTGDNPILPETLASKIVYDTYLNADDPADISSATFSGTASAITGLSLIGHEDLELFSWGGQGTYQGLAGNGWNASLSNISRDETNISEGYLIGNLSGTAWQNNEFSGTWSGREIWYNPFMDFAYNYLASYEGELIGGYDNDQAWQAVGAGILRELPLQLGASFDGGFGAFLGGEDGFMLSGDSSLSAIMGTADDPWTGTSALTVMGEFSNPSNLSLWANGGISDNIIGKTDDGGVILGEMGGTINVNNLLTGLFGAFYIRPNLDPLTNEAYPGLCGYLLSTDLTGSFYPGIGMFEATGDVTKYLDYPTIYSPEDLYDTGPGLEARAEMDGIVTGDGFSGTILTESAAIPDQGWTLWRGASGGTYTSIPTSSWTAQIDGRLWDSETAAPLGYATGTVSGEAWSDGQFSQTYDGYWIVEDGYGSFTGQGIGTYADNGTWQALGLGIGTPDVQAILPLDYLIGTDDSGQFNPGGAEINATTLFAWMLNTPVTAPDMDRGIFYLMSSGTYANPTGDDWDIYDMTGMTISETPDGLGGSWMGGITGTKWSGNELAGHLDSVWIALHEDGTLSGRSVSGEVAGDYVEVDTQGGTWTAESAGEWIEVNTNLLSGSGSPAENLDANIIALGQAANVPITEVYTSLLSGTGTGGITSATMDMHVYAMDPSADGIWASIINGSYTTAPTTDWSITLQNGADNALLSGPAWTNDQWIATSVTGTVDGKTVDGQAAGTYGGGTFTGAGTGTWETP